MKKKIEITENEPLKGLWVYSVQFGEAPGDVKRIGYNDPSDLRDHPAWVRRHYEQEIEGIHSEMSTWWGTRHEIPPVEVDYVMKCIKELEKARTESLTAARISRQIDIWYYDEINSDNLTMRNIATAMRAWWLTLQNYAEEI